MQRQPTVTNSSAKGTSHMMSQNMSQEMLKGSDVNMQSMAAIPDIDHATMPKVPQRRVLNEQEKHAGWQECIVSHKRHIINSLHKTLDRVKTNDKDRARKILDDEIMSIQSKQYNPNEIKLRENQQQFTTVSPLLNVRPEFALTASRKRTVSTKKDPEVTTLSQILNNRNQLYCEPFDVFDPNHPLRGKRRFNDNFRPLRSKINLKITAEEAQRRKRSNKVSVEQKILDDFEAAYAENCNQDTMRIKHRMVGPDNPFHVKNKPPDQYITPETIADKPCVLDHRGEDTKKIPFSGKLGNLGYKILEDFRKAKHVTSFDWQEEQFKDSGKRSPHKKPAKDITAKLTLKNFENDGHVEYHQQNFNALHKMQIYPAAQHTVTHRNHQNSMHRSSNVSPSASVSPTPFKTYDHTSVRDDMSQSPRGISPTERRVDYLVKAKAERRQKNEHRRMFKDSMAASSAVPSTTRNANNASNLSSFGKRNMTLDHGRRQSAREAGPSALGTHRHSVGPIGVPRDIRPQDIIKSKNESIFTNSLLAGDAYGYSHMEGGAKHARNASAVKSGSVNMR